MSNYESKTLESSIPNIFVGISKAFIQSALEYLHLSNTVSSSSLKNIYDYICNILSKDTQCFCNNFKKGYSVYTDNIEQKSTNSENNNSININNNFKVNFFIDDFYYQKGQEDTFINYRNDLLKILSHTLDKLISKLNNINEKINSCENMDKYKLCGELLISNIYRLDPQVIKNNNYSNNSKEFKNIENDKIIVTLENYYDNNNPVDIEIDTNLSISQNAEKYFKKYNKMKSTLSIVSVQKKQTNTELNYLESLIQGLDNCQSIADVDEVYDEISANILFSDLTFKNKKKSTNKENPSMLNNYIKLQVDGYNVCIGKNNKQNDYLTLKVANDNDYWFHAKDIHGSHLILKCNGEMPKISTITKCAKLCAYYSKAKFSSHVPVDYTLIKFVKKPHGANPRICYLYQ